MKQPRWLRYGRAVVATLLIALVGFWLEGAPHRIQEPPEIALSDLVVLARQGDIVHAEIDSYANRVTIVVADSSFVQLYGLDIVVVVVGAMLLLLMALPPSGERGWRRPP
jgi:hypothetical protein